MAMSDYSVNGIGELVVTLPLDSTTKTTIGKNYDAACGNAVALTANNTVGYGSSGDALFGIIKGVEHDGAAAIQVKGFAVDIPSTGSLTVGGNVAVDGAGKVKTAESGTAVVTSADTSNNVCDILL